MKRFLSLLFTTLLLTVALCVTASASDFDAVAEDLSTIGMFRGTANGFELDRVPTRSEAAIMLVRLYGAEEAAKAAYEAGEISHPFTDVSDFTSPYVAWLYTNGITNGFTDTTFASQRPCSAQNYATFLLRALGYKDGTDFAYADALTFAQEKGFYDPAMFSGEFLRDDLAALTYQGLAADTADGETYLLDKLVESGAIDASTAKPMTEKMEAYRTLAVSNAAMDENAMDMDIAMKMDATMSAAGESITTSVEANGNMQMVMNDTDIQLAYLLETTTDGVTIENKIWMKDGWIYFYNGDDLLKYQMQDPAAVLEDIEPVDMSAMDVSGLAMLDSITSKKSGSNTIYTVVISEDLGGVTGSVSDMTGIDDAMSMTFSPITADYTVDSRGNLKSIAMVFSATMTMEIPAEDGTTLSMDLKYDYDMLMKINATGSQVKITYPNLSDATEVVGGNSWPVGM